MSALPLIPLKKIISLALVISYRHHAEAMDVPANSGEVPAKNKFFGSRFHDFFVKSRVVAELGPLTASGSGLINMAIVGGAIIPVIQGAMADSIGIHQAFILPVICYLYILFYALRGSKPNSERFATA